MLTVKEIDRHGNESLYEADDVSRISPNGTSAALPGLLVSKDGALVRHIQFSGEETDDAKCSSNTVAAYVMNSSGATVATYRCAQAAQPRLLPVALGVVR